MRVVLPSEANTAVQLDHVRGTHEKCIGGKRFRCMERKESVLGLVEVRQVFRISKVGTVAGCYVQEAQ